MAKKSKSPYVSVVESISKSFFFFHIVKFRSNKL